MVLDQKNTGYKIFKNHKKTGFEGFKNPKTPQLVKIVESEQVKLRNKRLKEILGEYPEVLEIISENEILSKDNNDLRNENVKLGDRIEDAKHIQIKFSNLQKEYALLSNKDFVKENSELNRKIAQYREVYNQNLTQLTKENSVLKKSLNELKAENIELKEFINTKRSLPGLIQDKILIQHLEQKLVKTEKKFGAMGRNAIDEDVLAALERKELGQDALLNSVKARIQKVRQSDE